MKPYTIYGRPYCGYCSQAVKVLQSMKLEFEYIDVYQQKMSKEDVGKRVKQRVSTWPQIMHGDKYVGGCNELVSYLKEGAK